MGEQQERSRDPKALGKETGQGALPVWGGGQLSKQGTIECGRGLSWGSVMCGHGCHQGTASRAQAGREKAATEES